MSIFGDLVEMFGDVGLAEGGSPHRLRSGETMSRQCQDSMVLRWRARLIPGFTECGNDLIARAEEIERKERLL